METLSTLRALCRDSLYEFSYGLQYFHVDQNSFRTDHTQCGKSFDQHENTEVHMRTHLLMSFNTFCLTETLSILLAGEITSSCHSSPFS